MKVSFSRKGFDSANGGFPSPILPDGTMLPLPIPSGIVGHPDADRDLYEDIMFDGCSYREWIEMLGKTVRFAEQQFPLSGMTCHVDPDLYFHTKPRMDGWKPSFGQMNGPLSHLMNQGLGVGDLFLFYGLYRHTEWRGHTLRFVGPVIHAVYGYMQVGQIIDVPSGNIPQWLYPHPHTAYKSPNNKIFLAADNLSFFDGLPGAALLRFNEKRQLTKAGMTRSKWNLPEFFKQIHITGCKGWKDGYFQSGSIGQEFVWETNDEAESKRITRDPALAKILQASFSFGLCGSFVGCSTINPNADGGRCISSLPTLNAQSIAFITWLIFSSINLEPIPQ